MLFVHPGCTGLLQPVGNHLFAVSLRAYLLDVLLEDAQLQPLVQSDLSMLPDILKTPLMVEDLVHNIQDAMNLQENSDVVELWMEII